MLEPKSTPSILLLPPVTYWFEKTLVIVYFRNSVNLLLDVPVTVIFIIYNCDGNTSLVLDVEVDVVVGAVLVVVDGP